MYIGYITTYTCLAFRGAAACTCLSSSSELDCAVTTTSRCLRPDELAPFLRFFRAGAEVSSPSSEWARSRNSGETVLGRLAVARFLVGGSNSGESSRPDSRKPEPLREGSFAYLSGLSDVAAELVRLVDALGGLVAVARVLALVRVAFANSCLLSRNRNS
jgi:hypothetical protein